MQVFLKIIQMKGENLYQISSQNDSIDKNYLSLNSIVTQPNILSDLSFFNS